MLTEMIIILSSTLKEPEAEIDLFGWTKMMWSVTINYLIIYLFFKQTVMKNNKGHTWMDHMTRYSFKNDLLARVFPQISNFSDLKCCLCADEESKSTRKDTTEAVMD